MTTNGSNTGSKALRLSFFIFLASFMVFLASFLVYISDGGGHETDVFGPYADAVVRNTLPNTPGPALLAQTNLVMTQERCINSDEPVRVETTLGFRFIERTPETPEEIGRAPLYFDRAPQTRLAHCNTAQVEVQLPPEVMPGIWRVEGLDRCTICGEVRHWASEIFLVVAPRGQ